MKDDIKAFTIGFSLKTLSVPNRFLWKHDILYFQYPFLVHIKMFYKNQLDMIMIHDANLS